MPGRFSAALLSLWCVVLREVWFFANSTRVGVEGGCLCERTTCRSVCGEVLSMQASGRLSIVVPCCCASSPWSIHVTWGGILLAYLCGGRSNSNPDENGVVFRTRSCLSSSRPCQTLLSRFLHSIHQDVPSNEWLPKSRRLSISTANLAQTLNLPLARTLSSSFIEDRREEEQACRCTI